MNIPKQIQAGDSYNWIENFTEYSANDGWVLSIAFRNQGNMFDIIASPNDDGNFDIEILADNSADYVAGKYIYSAFVIRNNERKTLETGTIEVLPDIRNSVGVDLRSHNQKVLDALRAVIEKRANKEQQSITINGRAITYLSLSELINQERYYASKVENESKPRKTGFLMSPVVFR